LRRSAWIQRAGARTLERLGQVAGLGRVHEPEAPPGRLRQVEVPVEVALPVERDGGQRAEALAAAYLKDGCATPRQPHAAERLHRRARYEAHEQRGLERLVDELLRPVGRRVDARLEAVETGQAAAGRGVV